MIFLESSLKKILGPGPHPKPTELREENGIYILRMFSGDSDYPTPLRSKECSCLPVLTEV
jgi:hypothetical protein